MIRIAPVLVLVLLGSCTTRADHNGRREQTSIAELTASTQGDISALAAQMTALSWDVSPYTVSGTNNATEMATMVITMQQAWKYDPSYATLIETYYYQAFKTVSRCQSREKPDRHSTVMLPRSGVFFPTTYGAGNQYENYNAIASWDVGAFLSESVQRWRASSRAPRAQAPAFHKGICVRDAPNQASSEAHDKSNYTTNNCCHGLPPWLTQP